MRDWYLDRIKTALRAGARIHNPQPPKLACWTTRSATYVHVTGELAIRLCVPDGRTASVSVRSACAPARRGWVLDLLLAAIQVGARP